MALEHKFTLKMILEDAAMAVLRELEMKVFMEDTVTPTELDRHRAVQQCLRLTLRAVEDAFEGLPVVLEMELT